MTATDDHEIIEMPAALPADGRRAWYFPGARDHGHADLVVRITRRDGSAWIACLGETMPPFVLPCGARVFLADGIADRDDPESWRPLNLARRATVTWAADRRVVAFCDGYSLDVYGTAGPLWHARDVGDMRVMAVSADAIVCSVYDPTTGDDVERRFATLTGAEH